MRQLVKSIVDKTGVRDLEPLKEALKDNLYIASTIAAFAALGTVLGIWGILLRNFRARVLAGRRGKFTLVWKNTHSGLAGSFVGISLGLTGVGFLFTW